MQHTKKKTRGVPQQIQVQRDGQYGTAQSKHLNPVDCTSFSLDKEQCLQHSYQIKSRICTPPWSKRVLKQINVKNVFPFFKKRASESEILSPLNWHHLCRVCGMYTGLLHHQNLNLRIGWCRSVITIKILFDGYLSLFFCWRTNYMMQSWRMDYCAWAWILDTDWASPPNIVIPFDITPH